MAAKSAPKGNSNAALTQKVIQAQAKVQQAQARANLIQAQIEVKGKQITWDYRGPGPSVPKVVDAPKVK